MAMEKDKTDEKVERYIADAFVRKGEQETLEELAGVESVDKLRQIMDDAERRYRPVPIVLLYGDIIKRHFRRTG